MTGLGFDSRSRSASIAANVVLNGLAHRCVARTDHKRQGFVLIEARPKASAGADGPGLDPSQIKVIEGEVDVAGERVRPLNFDAPVFEGRDAGKVLNRERPTPRFSHGAAASARRSAGWRRAASLVKARTKDPAGEYLVDRLNDVRARLSISRRQLSTNRFAADPDHLSVIFEHKLLNQRCYKGEIASGEVAP
jgi:hypothetical protein